ASLFLCALLTAIGVNAQKQNDQAEKRKEASQQTPQTHTPQQPAQKPAQPTQKDDEPVAITERSIVERNIESRKLASDEFGNFRQPIINNKGEIAFISFFSAPGSKLGYSQSIFVRGADGSWKVTKEGEKATNLSKGIYGFVGLLAFNDKGDLTF